MVVCLVVALDDPDGLLLVHNLFQMMMMMMSFGMMRLFEKRHLHGNVTVSSSSRIPLCSFGALHVFSCFFPSTASILQINSSVFGPDRGINSYLVIVM